GAPAGPDRVIHADKTAGVTHATTVSEFAGGKPVMVTYVPGSWDEARQIVERAWQTVGTPYDALGNNGLNCEHATSFHRTGEAKSPTLHALGCTAAVLGTLWLLGRGGRRA